MTSPGAGLFPRLIRQRTLVLFLSVGMMLGGAAALWNLPSGIYPELDFPRILVLVRSSDTPPDLMQASVVRPVEEGLATVLGVRRIRTKIIRGSAIIALQFTEGTDMWRALQLTDAAIANARGALPPDTEIETEKVTPADFPILSFNLVGGTSTARREAADFIIRPAFSRVSGVGRVEVAGGDPREIEVALDPLRAAALHLRPSEIAARVGGSIERRSVGRFDEWRQTVTETADTVPPDTADLARLPVARGPNGPIALSEVASVFEGAPDRTMAVHAPEGDAVQISVSRMIGASAPEVVRAIGEVARGLHLPEGIRIIEVYNQGALIRESILGIRDAIVLGILLTVGVLTVFLRNPRAGFLAALSVPTTLIATFLAMAAFGQTLNLMSLGGMAIAIGLVIDDAIVVIEAIVRRIEEGADPNTAAREGLTEMLSPVVGTTVTTVVVLAPLAFLSGIVGSFFTALAVTLASAVMISLFFALFLLPILASRVLRARTGLGSPSPADAGGSWKSHERRTDRGDPATGGRPSARLSPSARRRERGRETLSLRYAAALKSVLHRRKLALLLVAVALVAGVVLFRTIPSGFLPDMDEGSFVLDYFLPAGTSLEATSAAALHAERILASTPGIAVWARRTGTELGPLAATEFNSGDIQVLLQPRGTRRGAEEIIGEVRRRVETELPGVRVEFIQILEDVLNDLSGAPRPIEIKILGEDQSVLERLAGEVEKRLDGAPNLLDYYAGFEARSPMLRYVIDAGAAARNGLTPADVLDDLGTALHGTVVGAIPRFDRLVPVRVRLGDEFRFRPDALASTPFAIGSSIVPLSRLAPPVRETVPSVLYRENLSPVAPASCDVEGGDIGGLAREIDRRLAGLTLPAGYRIEIGGRVESQARAFAQILSILAFGLFAVFAVLVAQLRSARAALLVLLTVPPALVGAVVLLAATGVPLNVSSMMGVVLLVGLVVKNGILLVQHALLKTRAGVPAGAAIVSAGRRRLRPILMTTLCTIFGLLPLAFSFGAGSELQRPLAVVVIGGLAFSTVATLFVLPTLAGALLPRDADPEP